MEKFGGETSEARGPLARLGGADSLLLVSGGLLGVVLGVLAMEEGSIGCLYLLLLDLRLLVVVFVFVLVDNTSSFDFGLLGWPARVLCFLQLQLVLAVAVAEEYGLSCP